MTDERLREHPGDRLASPTQVVHLSEVAARLRAEPHAAVSGHRQIAIVRDGPVRMFLFAFDHDGELKEHHAEGIVTIQVLSGRLRVTVAKDVHELGPGQLVTLARGIPHSVRALAASNMLLTVHRVPAENPAG
jgi:quercetin dioxygenase-like cupin family protein